MTRGMAMVLTFVTLAFAMFAGWYSSQRADYFPDRLGTTFSVCERLPGVPERRVVQEPFEDRWYSGELAAFGEPSLYRRPATTPRSLRFTWIRSFHDPVVVRIDTAADGRQTMTARRRPGGHGFGPAPGVKRGTELIGPLSRAETTALQGAINDVGLFEAPASGCASGVDGAIWIIEAADPELGYRYRARHSPKAGLEHSLGLHLLALTGWNVEPVY